LVSDLPAGDGKTANLFYSVGASKIVDKCKGMDASNSRANNRHHAATSWCKDDTNGRANNSRNTCNSMGAGNMDIGKGQEHGRKLQQKTCKSMGASNILDKSKSMDASNSRANKRRNTCNSLGASDSMVKGTSEDPVTVGPTTEDTPATAWTLATAWTRTRAWTTAKAWSPSTVRTPANQEAFQFHETKSRKFFSVSEKTLASISPPLYVRMSTVQY
jgi:hypothetical protein